jgi:hypothetical protein
MSWSKRLRVLSFSMLALGGAPLLAACTLTPVYSDRIAEDANLAFVYAAPNSRLEQIVYQELSLRFGKSTAPNAPLATVTVGVSGAATVNTATVNPNSNSYNVTVTATLTLTQRGGGEAAPVVLTRRATAGYSTGAQVLNDQFAFSEASERAAKSAAESLRLAILATLAP